MEKIIGRYIRVPFFKLYWRVTVSRRRRTRVIVLHENNILLVRHIKSKVWSLPGGQVNKHEDFISAGVRELEEELGITDFVFEYILGTYSLKTKKRDDTVTAIVGSLSDEKILKLQWEIQEAVWFALDALPANVSRYVSNRVAEYHAGARDIVGSW